MSTDESPTTGPFDAARIAKAVRQRLQSLQRSGITSIRTPNASQPDLSSLQTQIDNVQQNSLLKESQSTNEIPTDDQRAEAEDHAVEIAVEPTPPTSPPPTSPPTPSLTLNISRETAVMPSKKQSESVTFRKTPVDVELRRNGGIRSGPQQIGGHDT